MVRLKWIDIIDAFAVLLGDYSANRKKAAHILLKYFAPRDVFKVIKKEVEELAPVTERNDPRVSKWRDLVVSRGVCEQCGAKENLEAHHIVYWSESPVDRINLENGACLCHECHTEEHKGEQVYCMMKAKIGGDLDG